MLKILDYTLEHPDIDLLITIFSGVKPLYIFGGFVRDYYANRIHRLNVVPKDLDVVLLSDATPNVSCRIHTNRFGGNCIVFRGKRINWWRLDRTYAFRVNPTIAPTLHNLPSTTIFTCNSLLYELHNHRVYLEENALIGIERRVLDFQDTSYLYDWTELQKERAVRICGKLNLTQSERVRRFLEGT